MKSLIKTLRIALLLLFLTPAWALHAAAPVITNLFMVPLLTIESDLGVTNQIQYSTNLSPTNWIALTNILVVQSPYVFVDVTATGPQRFYRVQNLVPPPPAASLTVTGFPSPRTAGVAGTFTVIARDTNGIVVPGYLGTVHFTGTDFQAVLPADYTFTAGDSGTHTFSATLNTAGTQTITATDTVNGTITGAESGIIINPAAAATITVSGFPSVRTAGVAGSFTVTARDAFGNTAISYSGTVHFTSNDGAASLPANYTFLGADAGVHTFSATLKTAGASRSITATDTVNSAITGTQSALTVIPAAASTFTVSGLTSPRTAGVAGTFTVTARDVFGNIATGYAGTVHFTSADAQAALPANYTFVLGDAGVKSSLSATLKTAGLQSITATDTVNASINGTQSSIFVLPSSAAGLVVSGFPNPQTSSVAGNFTVTARDVFGNTATSYLGTVHFTSTDAMAVLPANYTFVGGDSGAHNFSATLKTVGTQTITATDTVTGTITGTSSGITINP